MVKVYLDIPDEVDYLIRRIQIDLEMQGEKKPLDELYTDILKEGANQFMTQLRNQQGL